MADRTYTAADVLAILDAVAAAPTTRYHGHRHEDPVAREAWVAGYRAALVHVRQRIEGGREVTT